MIIKHTLTKVITALIVVFYFQLALATIPSTLNYQGHLTDSGGAPVDGPVDMVFSIYDVDAGGIALWSDSRTLVVDRGVFSVELGGASNPFPPGLFMNPAWIGLSVDTDAEMTPRRPISSVGFAFKASDADTLEGVSVSSLDQSAHVSDAANPHAVTAEQVGAADASVLSGHTGNMSNPHNVTAAQTGAVSSFDFNTHAAAAAAHHLRFTSGEAVAAMGANSDTNALNHDRYSDANTVAAMLASDGAGSTLDADLVDGLQASEIIDAAQDEVRTPIASLPFTIDQPGSYYLTGNLDGSSGGIDINASNVTLDLMGFAIDGGGAVNDHGIDFTGQSNVTILNGTITGFGVAGIYQGDTGASYATVKYVQTLGNGTLGTNVDYSGALLAGSNNHVERCTASDNGNAGIIAEAGSVLINNRAYNNPGYSGIWCGKGCTLTGNIAHDNGLYGIVANDGSSIADNTVYNNAGIGISGRAGAVITGNAAYSNGDWGVYAFHGTIIRDNAITYNNTLDVAGQGGLRVLSSSRVIGNTVSYNKQNNIYVFDAGNAIENNLVTVSVNGIYFNNTGNFYANNRAYYNTTDYAGSVPTGAGDGGGNASF